MIRTIRRIYRKPCELEKQLESAIIEIQDQLFGPKRIYLDTKKMIDVKGKQRNIPDGYLLDLTSRKEPKLYVVENEQAPHVPLRHVAVQILQLSLFFEPVLQTVKRKKHH